MMISEPQTQPSNIFCFFFTAPMQSSIDAEVKKKNLEILITEYCRYYAKECFVASCQLSAGTLWLS